MEKSLVLTDPKHFKSEYCRLVATGMTESMALDKLKVEWIDFFEACAKDEEFRTKIDDARKARAEVWVGKIMKQVEEVHDENGKEVLPDPASIPALKLRFDQLRFLAKADNPDRYGESGRKGPMVAINMNDFKLLQPAEAMKALNNDPFNKIVTIEAESTPIKEDENGE